MMSVFVLSMIIYSGSIFGTSSLKKIIQEQKKINQGNKDSQERIDKVFEKTQDMLVKYRAANEKNDSMVAYNEQIKALIASQKEEIKSFQDQIDSLEQTSRDLYPLLNKMIAALVQFVELDLPFHREMRKEKLVILENLVSKANVSLDEKFRQVFEAYKRESNYGGSVEHYKATLKLPNEAQTKNMDVLRVGRIGLFSQSFDKAKAYVWNQELKQWQLLSDPGDLSRIMDVADKLRTPEPLLAIPMIRS